MNEIYHIETISELNKLLNQVKPKHPLVSIIDFSKVQSFGETDVKITTGFYSIMLKNSHCNNLQHFSCTFYPAFCSNPELPGNYFLSFPDF